MLHIGLVASLGGCTAFAPFILAPTKACGCRGHFSAADDGYFDDDSPGSVQSPSSDGSSRKLPRLISYGLGSRSPPATRKALGSANKKNTIVYVCEVCGSEQVQWVGRCPTCKEWNSVKEFRVPRAGGKFASQPRSTLAAQSLDPRNPRASEGAGTAWLPADVLGGAATRLSDVEESEVDARIVLPGSEMNRVLGGGLVPGGVVMIGGDPGIGKSTLLLQVAGSVAELGGSATDPSPVLYVSGEESTSQVASRARRLGIDAPDLFLLAETDVDLICEGMATSRPMLAVIDSVQTMRAADLNSAPGSITQVRECAARIVNVAKACGVATVLVGHVTKSGDIAGPRTVEHMVDTVLYLEGDSLGAYRMLRSVKNRFGSSNEIGVFEMVEEGMREVADPTLLFVSESSSALTGEETCAPTDGSAVMVTMEGSRPLLCEVQALVTRCRPPQAPRRAADGIPLQRLLLLLAVLQRRLGYGTGYREVYINVVGGLGVRETAADLAIAVAVVSSFCGIPTRPGTAFIGEIGLGGEVRMVPHLQRRIDEAAKFGFQRVIIPRARQRNKSKEHSTLELVEVRSLQEAVSKGLLSPPPPPQENRRTKATRRSSIRGGRQRDMESLEEEDSVLPGRMGYEPPGPGTRKIGDLY
jgi:DNA repair protein RadA/Sms